MDVKRLLAGTWLFLTLGFAACTDELGFEDRRVEEGLPARVSLSVRPAESAVVSRAANEGIESQVNNLYLFIFSSDGTVMYRNYWDANTLQHTAGSLSQGTLNIHTTSANDTRIVGVANLTDGAVSSAYTVTKDMLDAVTTLDGLKALKFDMETPSVSRMGAFLMTGFAEKDGDAVGEDKTSVDITPSDENDVPLGCTLWLERVDARVKFVVTAEAENIGWKNFSFQPREWRVCEVPRQTLALEGTTGDYDGTDAQYFSSPFMPFEDVTRVDETALYAGGSFEFYVPENRKTPRENITNNDYALREKRDKGTAVSDDAKPGQEYENDGAFTYAHARSTYVEMTGTLSYRDTEDYLVSASVTFTVHLGGVDNDVNDYNTNRNTRYTYNVKVKGVNNIVVEVTQEVAGVEPRPGYEGNVVFSSNETYFLDAHYDRALLHINETDIISADGQQEMSWGVRTPYGAGIYEGEITNNVKDYKWIKFAINKDYGTSANEYVKYPGDQNYNDPDRRGASDNDQPSGYSGHTNQDARLLDVKQLVERLKEEVRDGNSQIFEADGTVAVTAFIDEYVYVREPGQPNEEEDFMLWTEFVEEDDRQLHITNGRSQYSPDGASSVVESIYTFRQKSIRTVYDKTKVATAWGLESIMEAVGDKSNEESGKGVRLTPEVFSGENSPSNGRQNTINALLANGTLHWTEVVNVSEDGASLKSGFQNTLYACLTRNRDLNGNNIVEENEIRWYIASINQLTEIYIGEYALDVNARLYPEHEADRPGGRGLCWHYASSTRAGDGNPEIIWAEEGASRGNFGSSNTSNGEYYAYRCVRNLGIDLDVVSEEPEDLITCTLDNGTYLIDATRLNPKAKRDYSPTPLSAHNNLDESNLLYEKFRVSGVDSDYPKPEYTIDWLFDADFRNWLTWDQCVAEENSYFRTTGGYRLPNQRELLVMLNLLPSNAWRTYNDRYIGEESESKAMYMCKTGFAKAGEGHFGSERESFRMNAQNNTLGVLNNSNDRGYIRGVKDER